MAGYDKDKAATRGAVYCVVQSPKHLNLAVQSAASLKRHMPRLPVTLYTDLASPADSCFDVVERLPPVPLLHKQNKMAAMLRAGYDSFVLLDADTRVCKAFWEVFELVENPRVDFAAVPLHDWPGLRGKVTWMYKEDSIPDVFPLFSCGFVAIRRNARTVGFLEEWERCYRWMLEGVPESSTAVYSNEPAMRVALFRHPDLRIAPLPRRYNFKQHGILIHDMVILHKKGGKRELKKIERAVNAGAGHARVICWGEEKIRL